MLMLAIIFVGIGYMAKKVPMVQRSYHATTRNEDALTLSYLLTLDIKGASVITVPAEPGNAPTTASTLEINKLIWDSVSGWNTQHIEYAFNAANRQILRCQTNAVDCNPVSPADDLLSSWDNGRVGAESTPVVGAPFGTTFRRGIDVNDDGSLSAREKQFVRVELVLSQNEGPAGNQNNINNQVYYIESVMENLP
jgi:hypothetical protein